MAARYLLHHDGTGHRAGQAKRHTGSPRAAAPGTLTTEEVEGVKPCSLPVLLGEGAAVAGPPRGVLTSLGQQPFSSPAILVFECLFV